MESGGTVSLRRNNDQDLISSVEVPTAMVVSLQRFYSKLFGHKFDCEVAKLFLNSTRFDLLD